jgi:serine protease Do
MRRTGTLLTIFFTLISSIALAQKLEGRQLEQAIDVAIQRSYAACVKIWGFDTTAKVQMSATFSGVVVTKDGHILTAAHVIQPGNTYQVTFPDGKKCIAIALGKITKNQIVPDVGMMKIIDRGNWPFAVMGHSASLRVNEPCISIAYPESLFQSLPLARVGYITQVKTENGFIQSTCIMEPGDSGGPLFDVEGQVIGLHSAIEVSEKMNFDVPVDLYRKYWQALLIPRVYHSFPKSSADTIADTLKSNVVIVNPENIYGNSLKKIAAKYRNTSVKITSQVDGKSQEALGTLIDLRRSPFKKHQGGSFIISKSSIIGNDSIMIQAAGRNFPVSVVARDQANDLVLLKSVNHIKGGIKYRKLSSDSVPVIKPGRFIVSIIPGSAGVYSAIGSGFIKMNKFFSVGSFGAGISFKDSILLLNEIQPNSPANNNDMEKGDQVLAINNISISNPSDFFNALNQYWPGDTITIKLKRAHAILDKRVILRPIRLPSSEHPAEHFAGGASKIRDGFNQVFSHDAILYPAMCGGPVFDSNGVFCGINIARYSRASTLAMPASIIGKFIFNNLK